jgi:hypothetical protein
MFLVRITRAQNLSARFNYILYGFDTDRIENIAYMVPLLLHVYSFAITCLPCPSLVTGALFTVSVPDLKSCLFPVYFKQNYTHLYVKHTERKEIIHNIVPNYILRNQGWTKKKYKKKTLITWYL